MSIGLTIKRLRRERDITQEQLAEYLGITSRAVSQWETDRTSPDISQIPALCHVFEVSADTLLGIETEKNNEAINNYIEKARDETNKGKFENSAAILREALHKFPRSYKIMYKLANSIVCVNSRKGNKNYEEVFALCKRILEECTDSTIRYETIDTLASAYGYAGKNEEMLKLAEEMPHVYFSYEDFMRYRWRGEADLKKLKDYMYYLVCRVTEMLGITAGQLDDGGNYVYSLEDRIRLHKGVVAFLEMVFSDGDYCFTAQFGYQSCEFLCTAYLRKKDYDEVWYWIEKRADFAHHMDTYDFDAVYTSPPLRGYSSGGWIVEGDGYFTKYMLEWLTTDEESAVLRSDERYERLVKRLEAVAETL